MKTLAYGILALVVLNCMALLVLVVKLLLVTLYSLRLILLVVLLGIQKFMWLFVPPPPGR